MRDLTTWGCLLVVCWAAWLIYGIWETWGWGWLPCVP